LRGYPLLFLLKALPNSRDKPHGDALSLRQFCHCKVKQYFSIFPLISQYFSKRFLLRRNRKRDACYEFLAQRFSAANSTDIFEMHFLFGTLLSRRRSRSLAANVAAASTNVYAGHKISITHGTFRGVTAAVAPNRKLCVRHFPRVSFLLLRLPLIVARRTAFSIRSALSCVLLSPLRQTAS
jgi:hypothetical protein